jgi:anaerobic selenocysteine-containing dehydrogenase
MAEMLTLAARAADPRRFLLVDVRDAARFEATSEDAVVTASIRTMVPAHAAVTDGTEGWTMQAEEIPGGAALTVTGTDPAEK